MKSIEHLLIPTCMNSIWEIYPNPTLGDSTSVGLRWAWSICKVWSSFELHFPHLWRGDCNGKDPTGWRAFREMISIKGKPGTWPTSTCLTKVNCCPYHSLLSNPAAEGLKCTPQQNYYRPWIPCAVYWKLQMLEKQTPGAFVLHSFC